MKKYRDLWIGLVLGLALIVVSWRGWIESSLTETLGFVTGAACVWLVVKQNVWNFPVGIANNVFFFVLFVQERLYGDAGLQVLYLGLAVHGWWFWLYGGEHRAYRRVEHASVRTLAFTCLFIVVGTVMLTYVLRAVKGSAPGLDALTTAISLAAQYLLNRKVIENWYFWIVADVLYIYLYFTAKLPLTGVLCGVLLALCLVGLLQWRRALAEQNVQAEGVA